MRSLRYIALPMMCVAALCGTAGAAVIRVKPSASVDLHQDVRLGDIASVTGDDGGGAEALSNTVIIAGAEKSERIRVDDILMALLSQRGATSGTSLQIAGAAECQINVRGSFPPAVSLPERGVQAPVSVVSAGGAGVAGSGAQAAKDNVPVATGARASDDDAANTLEDLIRGRVTKELGGAPEDISIHIDTISPLIDHPLAPGTKWLCRPLTRSFLGTVSFEAQLVQGTKVLERLNVQTTVEQMQMVPVSTVRLGRGDIVTADAVKMQRVKLDRRMPSLFAGEHDVIGLECQKDMDPGTMLDTRDFRPAYMAHKNEPLTVVYVAGALSVQMRGRALEDAKMHEQVRIRNETTREEYSATMIGKDLAVAGETLTPEQEAKLREGIQP